jgi:hypothetical protein
LGLVVESIGQLQMPFVQGIEGSKEQADNHLLRYKLTYDFFRFLKCQVQFLIEQLHIKF